MAPPAAEKRKNRGATTTTMKKKKAAEAEAEALETVVLAQDVPWRNIPEVKGRPRINSKPLVRVRAPPYALRVMDSQRIDPVGGGWAMPALLEPAGPDCIVPGLVRPLRLLGVQLWPVHLNLRFLQPVGRQLQSIGKFLDSSVNLMNKSFGDSS